jgi:predicted HD phosphohydrolase
LLSENWASAGVADKHASASETKAFRSMWGDSVVRQAWHSKAARHICDIDDPYVTDRLDAANRPREGPIAGWRNR